MKKQLRFEIRQNIRKPARVYIKSPDLKTYYGSFHVDKTEEFTEWDNLTIEQHIELKQFIQNVKSVYQHIKPAINDPLADFRFRLPAEFISAIKELEQICHAQDVELNIFDAMVTAIIQQMKISTSKLTDDAKTDALTLLNKVNLSDFKKQDHSSQIQSVFSSFQAIENRSEKLHKQAIVLFDKDKSYSPRAIKGMAMGETKPSKWLVACAIEILLDEKPATLQADLSFDDFNMLWINPLVKVGYNKQELLEQLAKKNIQ